MKRIVLVVIIGILSLQSCEKDPISPQEFNDLIKALEFLNQPDELPSPIEVAVVEEADSTGDYVCSVKRYKAAPGYNELFLMDPTSDIIFPGALIKGESIPTGEYIPIVADRKPMTISISLQNIEGSPYRTIENPKLSTVREAINDILSGEVTGATPARVSFEIEEVYSEEQLAIAIGGNYKNKYVDVAGSFDFDNETVNSRMVVKFLQTYYTIDMDPPEKPDDLFQSFPGMGSLGSTSPLYVSTITYGRMVLFTVESDYSSLEMKAALDAAFTVGVQEGSIDASANYSKIIEKASVKAFILGGSGDLASQSVFGIDGIIDYITTGGNYSKDSPGAPLSYKLRYLKDNSVANIILASEYNVRQCQRIYSDYTLTLMWIFADYVSDGDGKAEMYGFLGFSVMIPDEGPKPVILWDHSDPTSYQTVDDVGGYLKINKSAQITLPLDKGAYLILGGHLWELDDGGSDDLGETLAAFTSDQFADTWFTVHFNGDGFKAEASYQITPNVKK